MIIEILLYLLLIFGVFLHAAIIHDIFFENKWLSGPIKNNGRLF